MARGRSPLYDDQRDAILRSAAHLFANRGYVGTSMNQIAQACGVSKAALYHYYRDKYALLVEIAEGHVDKLGALARDVDAPSEADVPGDVSARNEVLASRAPQARMRMLIHRIIAEYADAQDAHRVLTEDVRFLEEVDRARILKKEREVVDTFAAAIRDWQPAHHEAGLTTPLTMLLFGMINWMFTWMKPDGPLSHEAMAPIVADLFFGGVPAVNNRPPRRPTESIDP